MLIYSILIDITFSFPDMSATLYIRYCHKYKNNMFIICPLSNPSLIILFARYMHFDVQKAIELLGEKYVNEAKQAALNSSSNLNITFGSYVEGNDKISYCLDGFYNANKTQTRRKRDLSFQNLNYKEVDNVEEAPFATRKAVVGLSDPASDVVANTTIKFVKDFGTRRLLSLENPNFEDAENAILSNDIVSKALGTDVCRYCVQKCPAD